MEPLNHKEFDQYLKNEVDNANFTPKNEWESIADALNKNVVVSAKTKSSPLKWASISAVILLTGFGLSYLLQSKPQGYQPSEIIAQTNETTQNTIKNNSKILSGEPTASTQISAKQKTVEPSLIADSNVTSKESHIKKPDLQSAEEVETNTNAVEKENNLVQEYNPIEKIACVLEEVIWDFNEGLEGVNYLWNFGDGTFSNEANPTHIYSRAGVYNISLSTKKRKSSEIESRQISGEITVFDKPSAEFDFIKEPNGNVRFKALENHENITYKWFVNDKFIASDAEFLLNRSSAGKPLEIKLETYINASCKSVHKTYLNLSF
jgi:hypothetical protein